MVIKKIAILCNYELLPERVGGMDYFFWQFDAKCKENNIHVDWFFPNNAGHGEYKSLTIFDCKYQNVASFFLEYCAQNKTDYTTIISHFVELCTPFFKKIKQYSTAKIIAVDHNPRPIQGYPFKKKFEKIVKGFLYSKYIDLFVGVSDYTVNEILKDFGHHLKTKTITIYNGVLIQDIKIRTERNQNKLSFLVASHLRESKGIQDLIAAVALLPETIKNEIKIDIYGDGPLKSVLLEKVKSEKLDTNFNFKGSVSNLNELYQNYDYLIHPSHGETFCYAVVEALLCRLPVITTKNQGNVLGLVLKNINGFLFDERNINQLQDILKNIIENHILLDNSVHYNNKVNDFTLDKMVAHYYTLIS